MQRGHLPVVVWTFSGWPQRAVSSSSCSLLPAPPAPCRTPSDLAGSTGSAGSGVLGRAVAVLPAPCIGPGRDQNQGPGLSGRSATAPRRFLDRLTWSLLNPLASAAE